MISRRRLGYWINMIVWSGFIIMLLLLINGYMDGLCQRLLSIPNSKSNIHREAIVSIFYHDLYLPGILVLGYSLKKYNVSRDRDMIALLPTGALYDTRHILMLQAVGWSLVYVKRIPYPAKVNPTLVDGLMKLYAWNMTQYDIIATLDADTMIINSIEEPFQEMRRNHTIQMFAVDDAEISLDYRKELRSYFNSGVLFFRPNAHHFNELVRLSSNTTFYNFDFPQQNLLNKYFHRKWVELRSSFNMLNHLNGRHPIWLNQTDKFRIVHYAGPRKPWQQLEDPKGKTLDTDLIWRRYFAALVTENGWKKEDFLAPLASQTLRDNLRYDEWMAAI